MPEIDPSTLQGCPSYYNHVMMAWAVGNRIYQLPQDVSPRVLTDAWSNYYYHRGEAIERLASEITKPEPARRVIALVTLGMFLCTEV